MCKVFLVDDEIVAREEIRASLPWEELGFELIGEAADGEIALSMLREVQPNILITDIRMPYMDGMELCRRVRGELPETRIVIVSASENFAYAQEALSLGVKGFLSKPVDAAVLRGVLTRISADIREKERRESREAAFQEYMAASGRFLREKLLQDLYGGADADTVLRFARAMRINLAAKRYLVMLARPALNAPDARSFSAIQGVLEQLVQASGGTVFLQREGMDFSLLLLGDDVDHLTKRAEELANAARSEVERATGIGLLIAVGEDVEALSDISESLLDARVQLDAATRSPKARGPITPEALALSEIDGPPLGELLKYASVSDVEDIINRCAKTLNAARSEMLESHFYVDVLLEASRIIRESQGDPHEIIPEAFQVQGGLEEMLSLCREMLCKAIAFRDSRGSARYGSVIRKAQAYIGEHFADSGLTLGDVAAHVALSNNHFCTIFSREMGVTFIEYLTSIRINRAGELLRTTNMRTSEVAYAVGYNDPHYFSYLFKKNTGTSPRDYRRSASIVDRDDVK